MQVTNAIYPFMPKESHCNFIYAHKNVVLSQTTCCHAQKNKNTPKTLKTEDSVKQLESKVKAYAP